MEPWHGDDGNDGEKDVGDDDGGGGGIERQVH